MADKKLPLTAQPSLTGKTVFLRPASPEDIANTHHWVLHSDPQSMTCHPRTFQSAADASEGYKKREKSAYEQMFMIVRKKDNEPVGRINMFNYNHLNRSAEFGLLVDPDERNNGYGKEAVRLLSQFLFQYRGLNKIVAATSAFNDQAVGLLESLGFKRDGTLRDHYFYRDEYHDGYVYSLLKFER